MAGIGTKKDNINKIDEQFEEELVLAFDGKPIPDSDKQKILEYVDQNTGQHYQKLRHMLIQ